MSEIVKCDICGQIYNQSYVNAHKRLAHGKRLAPGGPAKSEHELQAAIVSLYARLSEQSKQEVRSQLGTAGETAADAAQPAGRKRRSRPPS